MHSGYIKLHRSMLDWEWYDEPNVLRLFLHFLLTVNYKPKKWHGLNVGTGKRVASIATLAAETRLSPQQIRTAAARLKSTKEIASQSINVNGSPVTMWSVVKYDVYQLLDMEENPTSRLTSQATSHLTSQATNAPSLVGRINPEAFDCDEKNVTSQSTSHLTSQATSLPTRAQQVNNKCLTTTKELNNIYTPLTPLEGGEVDSMSLLPPAVAQAMETWLKYKAERRQTYKPTGLKVLLGQVQRQVEQCGDDYVCRMIEQSMAANYSGIIWKQEQQQPAKREVVYDDL